MIFPLGPLLHNTAALSSGSGGGAWTPASLTGVTLWIEADPATLYTDAGTTLVSSDGQAVQQANDKSGNARNISNGTLANRPLYKVGTPHYLSFDGSNDWLESAGGQTLVDGSGQCWIAFCGQLADITTNQHILTIRNGGGGQQARLYVAGGSLQAYADSGSPGAISTTASAINTQFVAVVQLTTAQLQLYLNNAAAVTGSTSTSLDTSTAAIFLGSNFGAASFMNGQCKAALCGTGVLSGTDRTNLYTYLAAL